MSEEMQANRKGILTEHSFVLGVNILCAEFVHNILRGVVRGVMRGVLRPIIAALLRTVCVHTGSRIVLH